MKRLSTSGIWSVMPLAVMHAFTAFAQDAHENLRACMKEPDDARRLQCYDAEMTRQAVLEAPNDAQASKSAVASAPLSPEERFGLNEAQARKKEDLEEPPELDRLTATVTAVALGPQGELVLTLGNGQVWVQRQAASLQVNVGETVTIRKAALGSYMMSTASGRATRVRRTR